MPLVTSLMIFSLASSVLIVSRAIPNLAPSVLIVSRAAPNSSLALLIHVKLLFPLFILLNSLPHCFLPLLSSLVSVPQ